MYIYILPWGKVRKLLFVIKYENAITRTSSSVASRAPGGYTQPDGRNTLVQSNSCFLRLSSLYQMLLSLLIHHTNFLVEEICNNSKYFISTMSNDLSLNIHTCK